METILTWLLEGLKFIFIGCWLAAKGWWFGHLALFNLLGGGETVRVIFALSSPFILYWEYKLIRKLYENIRYKMKRTYCLDCHVRIQNHLTFCDNCQKKRDGYRVEEQRKDFQKKKALAKQYETMGRFEEAAQIYEYLAEGRLKPDGYPYFTANPKYLEEAGRVRKLARTEYVKESHVDLNQLLFDLKEYVNYKCPNCGSGIGINNQTSPDELRFCAHCGSELNTKIIMDFLKAL